ncbi:MAG: 16S rRNA (adenine(1518)-N(6)/adenine(1519)-N(6))-dimethyltransferase RsmA [Rickettsiales bacterium]
MINPDTLPPLSEVIATFGLAPKKSLGQHFLLDGNLLARIVRAAGDISAQQIIEIGPGPGGLTRAILAAGPRHLIAIEKDARCIAALASLQQIYPQHFSVIERDALGLDLAAMGQAPRSIIANLPYNVGTAMVVEWVQQIAQHGAGLLQSFTVLLQKEVAERMTAQVGDSAYGRLSILLHQFTDASLMFEVPASAFSPPPKVTSAVLHARVLQRPREDVPLRMLERVVAAAFNNRRKMLRQSLKSLGVDAIALCAATNIPETHRAEQCDLAMFARLTREFIKLQKE